MIHTRPSSDSGPPHLAYTLTEGPRCALELAGLFISAPFLAFEPRGHGEKVIVLPGFSLDDHSTLVLRAYLTWLGYQAHALGAGHNFGRRTFGEENQRLTKLVADIRGDDKVALIGHSLGGALAREYAREHPAQVSRVITLGSPYAGDETSMPTPVVWLRRSLTSEDPYATPDRSPLPVPHTAIFSESDGIVAAFDCRDESDGADNVVVVGSHVGLVINAQVFRAIAERLARD
ncbi:MAG TPA: alpha/beta hydrolase [Caulobacteraceae bacterium]|jgi:pimeloyl-ACP methyl ester carboxylesterase|nr:alpha/beta hydrolase [Caulobacteraceae bacterium]